MLFRIRHMRSKIGNAGPGRTTLFCPVCPVCHTPFYVLCVALAMGAVSSSKAFALPPDPQRAFVAQSCDAALVRLAEAETGSPLVSAAELQDVRDRAHQQAARLCGVDYDQMTEQTE